MSTSRGQQIQGGAHLPHGTQPLATRTGTPKASLRRDYFWLVGDCEELEPEATDTDRWALAHGYVAITPTNLDVTDYELLNVLKQTF